MHNHPARINLGPSEGLFFHPRPDRRTTNSYVDRFYRQLDAQVRVLNKGTEEKSRSVELLQHMFQTKVLVLNWPEDIIFLRGGLLQALLFNLCTLFIRIRGGRVVWICHNRNSHNKSKPLLSKWNRAFFKKVATTIVVHSADALECFRDVAGKTVFMPHPRYDRQDLQTSLPQQEPEVLIWGSITPYKGLDAFIAAYKQRGARFGVSIRGKANAGYFAQLQKAAQGTAINLTNELLSDAGLEQAFARCSIILLPYQDSDTFSSGALIHSLNARKIVIGPHIGNFIDLAAAGACLTYHTEDELFAMLNKLLSQPAYYQQTLERLQAGTDRFYDNHSWEAFTQEFLAYAGYRLPDQSAIANYISKVQTPANQTL